MNDDWHTTPEGREALSRVHSHETIPVLQLSTGRYAIFNHAWELCGIADSLAQWPPTCWHAKEPIPPSDSLDLPRLTLEDLKDLGIL